MLAGVTDGVRQVYPTRPWDVLWEAWPAFTVDSKTIWVSLLSPGMLFVDPRHVLAHYSHLRELTAKLTVPTRQGLAQPEHLPQGTTQKPPVLLYGADYILK